MAVTPNEVTDESSPEGGSWPKEDGDAVSWVADRQQKAEQRLGEWYEAAREAFGFYENKQWTETDAAKMESEKRVPVTFNRVIPIVNAVCGQEVSNRQEVKFLPRRVGEVNAADPMNDAVKWIRDNCNAEDEDSDAFKDMVISGMGWTRAFMSYEENPDGEGRVERIDPLLMRWDPGARRKNLADRKWNQADFWMTKQQIQERWPDADVTLLVNLSAPDHLDPVDTNENWKYKNEANGQDSFNDQWRVIHHVERFTKTVHRALDPATGQIQTYEEADFALISKRAKEIGLDIQSNAVQVRVFWEAWTVGKIALQHGIAKIQKDFQYQAMTCFRERETGFWFGLVLPMMDPQRYANRMASLLMSILATGPKGGIYYETGTFANPAKAKRDLARWDSAVELNQGGLAKFKPKDPVQLPAGAAEFMQFAITSIRDVTGANVEMLGMRQEDQPGVVEDMRTKAGLTILAGVFDAMRLYRKRQGIVLAEFVTKFLSDGRLIRIWGQQGQQFIPLVRQPDVIEYDVVVDESSASRDVKEKTWMVMGQVMPLLQSMGVPPPPTFLDYAPIPESLAMEIKKAIAQKQQQPPQPPPEVMKEQMRGEVQKQIAAMNVQVQQQAEAARTAADIQIAEAEARIKAATEQARDASQMQLEAFKAEQSRQTELIKAMIGAISKVAAAEVTASKDTDEDARKFTSEQAYPQ